MCSKIMVVLLAIIVACMQVNATAPTTYDKSQTDAVLLIVDNTIFIDANKILMFVTNHGAFGRDLDDIFFISPYGANGTWWPYAGDTSLISHNIDSAAFKSPLYGAGLWLGGVDVATGNTLVAISEYSSEYVPGPMAGGTFMPDEPDFRVYKLYMDSLASSPNFDYLNWPIDQGAPVDVLDNPVMLGRQMLWTVFNDADPSEHDNSAGSTAPLGIEIQQTVWAGDALGEDTIYYGQVFPVTRTSPSEAEITVDAWIVDRAALTGDEYQVSFEDTIITDTIEDPQEGTIIDTVHYFAWHLDNVTDCIRVLQWQHPDTTSDVVDGFRVRVFVIQGGFESFEVVANAGGIVDPPVPGAMGSAGFPTPDNADPGDDQQVGSGKWLFHVRDNGGTDVSNYCCFEEFVYYTLRGGNDLEALGFYDYEMRFTGSNANPGVNGSYAWEAYAGYPYTAFWVPFELWQTGKGTPDDPSDDVRLIPFIMDEGEDDVYSLENYGSDLLGNCGGYCEHSVSDGYDDPYTDWVYWVRPVDSSPGESGYLAAEADMLAGTFDENYSDHVAAQVMARTALVNWDGGVQPPFTQDYPEQGTVFRIRTIEPSTPPDIFTFTAAQPPYYVGSLEESSLYIKYKLYNNGYKTIENMYVGYWSDPDLGGATDDFVGCDTLNDIWFCYNADNDDTYYGSPPPAMGFKVLYGPVVPAPGNEAYFDGQMVPDYTNLGMTAFLSFFGGYDPDDFVETYRFLQGFTKIGDPYVYNDDTLTYVNSGDPVAGTGDLDIAPADRRMLAASGPFDMHPGDSQFVLIKMAVGIGTDNLNSVTELKAILNEPFNPLTDVEDGPGSGLPNRFAVSQNYPNPFNPVTRIEFSLPRRADVTIDIYNILGQKVKGLLDRNLPAGEHFAIWDGKSDAGESVSTGLYFYRVTAGESVISKKMLLLK